MSTTHPRGSTTTHFNGRRARPCSSAGSIVRFHHPGPRQSRPLWPRAHGENRCGRRVLSRLDSDSGFTKTWSYTTHRSWGFTFDRIPLALPMGWVESPPYSTVLTETACDRANVMLSVRHESSLNQAHRLEAVAAPDDAGVSLAPCRLKQIFYCWRKRVAINKR